MSGARDPHWRSRWTTDRASRTAVHVSGVTVRVRPSPTDPTRDRIALQNMDAADPAVWEPGLLMEQAMMLWMEGRM